MCEEGPHVTVSLDVLRLNPNTLCHETVRLVTQDFDVSPLKLNTEFFDAVEAYTLTPWVWGVKKHEKFSVVVQWG